jgi:uncharacterized protein involved in exopolysaccharide biosynthesis
LASGSALSNRPDAEAFRELEGLVKRLGEELDTFRRRALRAEARLRQLDGEGARPSAVERAAALERENAELRARLEAAADRTRQMLERVRFLRQQGERGAER